MELPLPGHHQQLLPSKSLELESPLLRWKRGLILKLVNTGKLWKTNNGFPSATLSGGMTLSMLPADAPLRQTTLKP
jgi:hypothetical protein